MVSAAQRTVRLITEVSVPRGRDHGEVHVRDSQAHEVERRFGLLVAVCHL